MTENIRTGFYISSCFEAESSGSVVLTFNINAQKNKSQTKVYSA